MVLGNNTNMTEPSFKILSMPTWKSKVLRAVAWILGYRGEYVYCITLNVDLDNMKAEKVKPKSDINQLLTEQEFFEE